MRLIRIAFLSCAFVLGLLLVGLPVSQARAQEQDKGFVSLFDGKSLSGWTGDGLKCFSVEKENLVCKQGCYGKLLTKREYSDFVFRFEFQLTPGANNGLAIRAPLKGDAAYVGIELQILDDSAEKYQSLEDYQYHGSAYGIAAAKRGALKPVGEWNSQEVRCLGRMIQVILNEQVILDVDLDAAAPNGRTIDGKEHPGLQRKQGYLRFLNHGDALSFRNIHIKELAPRFGI